MSKFCANKFQPYNDSNRQNFAGFSSVIGQLSPDVLAKEHGALLLNGRY